MFVIVSIRYGIPLEDSFCDRHFEDLPKVSAQMVNRAEGQRGFRIEVALQFVPSEAPQLSRAQLGNDLVLNSILVRHQR